MSDSQPPAGPSSSSQTADSSLLTGNLTSLEPVPVEAADGENNENTPLLPHTDSNQKPGSRDSNYKSLQSFPDAFSDTRTPSAKVKSFFSKIYKGATSAYAKSFWAMAGVLLLLVIVLQAMHVYWDQEFMNATTVDITNVDFEEFTDDGFNIRVQGTARINYTEVDHNSYRSWFLRMGAYPIHTLSLQNSTAIVLFKESEDPDDNNNKEKNPYEHGVTAFLPPLTFSIRHNETTHFDFVANLTDFGSGKLLGSIMRRIMTDEEIDFRIKSALRVHKGVVPLGNWPFEVDGEVNPSTGGLGAIANQFNLENVKINPVPKGAHGVSVAAMVSAFYNFSIAADIPELAWDLYVPGCQESDYVYVAGVSNMPLRLVPHAVNEVKVQADITKIPANLGVQCPGTNHSVIDQFAQQYISGALTSVKVRGSWHQPAGVPWWMKPVLPLIEITVPIRGQKIGDKLIRELELSDFMLTFPSSKNPFEKPKGLPKLSAKVQAIIVPPAALNLTEDIGILVNQVRGTAELFSSKGEQFATVDIPDWQPCETTTTMVDVDPDNTADGQQTLAYVLKFNLDKVPLNVTDEPVFGEIARQMLFSGSAPITLHAAVDANLETPVGSFVFSDIPIEGDTVLHT